MRASRVRLGCNYNLSVTRFVIFLKANLDRLVVQIKELQFMFQIEKATVDFSDASLTLQYHFC